MGQRTDLHSVLCNIMSEKVKLPEKHVYFQPPETVKLLYPCILYKLSTDLPRHADNIKYFNMKCYTVTVIDRNPDSDIPDLVAKLPYCRFDRFYAVDYLNHFVFELYY